MAENASTDSTKSSLSLNFTLVFFFYKKALNNEPKPFPNTTATSKFQIRFKV